MADVKFSQFTTGGEMMFGDEPVGLRPSAPTENFIFNFPGTGIKDANGNYLIQYASVGAGALNNLKFINSGTSQAVEITSVGADSNIGISILPKGTGAVSLSNLTYPTSDGLSGYVMTTNGAGVLSLQPESSTGDVNPGTLNQIAYYAAAGSTLSGFGTTNSAVQITNAAGLPLYSGTMTNGQLIMGSTGATPVANTITAGTGITVTNGAGTITLAAAATMAISFATDSGTATPAANTITISGSSTGLTTTGSGSTVGLTGTLALNHGGTNANLTASNGGIFYSTASAGAILSGTATAHQVLMSGANTTPLWSTATYPTVATSSGTILRADGTNWVASTATFADTYAVSTLLYASSSNAVSGLATANSAVLVTTSAGVPVYSGTMTNGQLIIGNTSGTPTAATITAGAGIAITNGTGTITIAAVDAAATWTVVTGASASMNSNNGYISNNAGVVTLTLPLVTNSNVGDVIEVAGLGAGGWKIAQNATQLIHLGSSVTTTGVGGSLASTNAFDSIKIVCAVAGTTWLVVGAPQSSGITVV